MRKLLLGSLLVALCVNGSNSAVAGAGAEGAAGKATRQPAQEQGTGLAGNYFANGSLAGAPVLRRLDASIDFQWGSAAPASILPADNFSVRWEGLLAAPSTGKYRFVARTSQEVRLWVNGKKIIDTWNGRKPVGGEDAVDLAAGEKTDIRLEYASGEGDARLQLQWIPPGAAAQTIPTIYLYPSGAPLPAPTVVTAPVAAAPKPAPAPAAPKTGPAPAAPRTVPTTAAPAVAAKAAAKPAATTKSSKSGSKAEPMPEIQSGNYVLTSRVGGTPLEVLDPARPRSRAYQPAAVGGAQTGSEGASTPQWRIENLGNGFYVLAVQSTNKVLEVLGSSTSNGAPMSTWSYYSGNNQLWRIEPAEEGYYKLVAKHSKKSLTLGDSTSGLHQHRYTGDQNQQWKLEVVVPEESKRPLMAQNATPGIGPNNMGVYPNPSNGVVQLTFELQESVPTGWVLYSQSGAAVRVSDYRRRPAGYHHQTLDFTSLPSGDYFLHLTVGTATTKQPLLIRQTSVPSASAVSTTE